MMVACISDPKASKAPAKSIDYIHDPLFANTCYHRYFES